MPTPFIWYANYYSTVYNEGGVGILWKYKIFRKFALNLKKKFFFFENIASFSCRGCQTLSPDMRIIFLPSIMKEE